MNIFKSRPDNAVWKPVANFSDSDERDAYERAARKLSVDIRISYPVPSPAGADYCAQLGMKGVYIRRSQSDRERDLTNCYFEELRSMSL